MKKIDSFCRFSFPVAVFILPFAKAGFEILLVIALVSWVSVKLISRGSFSSDRALLIVLGFFVISSSVSALNSVPPEASFHGMIKLLRCILVMLVAADLLANFHNLMRLFVLGLSSLVLVLTIALLQNVYGQGLFFDYPIYYANDQIRLTGPYQSYGLLAAHVMVFIPILIAMMANSQGIARMVYSGLILATFYILYRTQSRGSWLAALISLMVYGLLTRNKWLLATFVIIVLGMPFVFSKKIFLHMDAFGQESSLVERSLLWRRAVSVIKAMPWFGCGINTYTRNYSKYTQGEEWLAIKQKASKHGYWQADENETWRIPGHPNQIPNHYVHNGYLQMAAETGLISLALFLAIIGYSFYAGFRAFRRAASDKKPIVAGMICGLVALLLQAMVDTTLNSMQSAVLVWLFLGLLIAINRGKVFDARQV